MAFDTNEEDEVWKCEKHLTKNRRAGICANCLRERLNSLCRHCGQTLPCSCGLLTATPPPPTYSAAAAAAAISNLRKSRSLTVPVSRSKLSSGCNDFTGKWWNLKTKKTGEERESQLVMGTMKRSQSVTTVNVEKGKACLGKGRKWSFLNPMNVLRRSKNGSPSPVNRD